MRKKSTLYIVQSAIIAALYAGLTMLISPLSYGPIQFRFSEALTILPVFTPAAIPGLTIGCLIANLTSPYGLPDIIFGTLATLIAAILTRLVRNILVKDIPILAPICPVICNGLIIGAEICIVSPDEATATIFLTTLATVALGEFVICYLLGIPLYLGIKKTNIFKNGDIK